MSLVADAVVSARRMSRYQSLRIAQQRAGGDYWEGLQRTLLRFGIPALAPAFALIGVAFSTTWPGIAVPAVLGVMLLMVWMGARSRFTAFDLLRHPSRRGLVLGAALHAAPWLAWCGACSALAIGWSVPGAHTNSAGLLVLGVAFLLPGVAALRGGSQRVLERAGANEIGRLLPIVVFFLARGAARHWLPDYFPWLIGAIAAVISAGAVGSALSATVREVAFIAVVAVCLALPLSEKASLAFASGDDRALVVAAVAVAAVLFLLVSELRVQLRHVGQMEVIRSRGDDGDSAAATAQSSRPVVLRERRAGAGLFAARRRYFADQYLPDPTATLGWWKRAMAWTGPALVLAFVVLRGPALAVLAVMASGAESGGVLVGAALLAAFWASRALSVDTMDFDERIWLLGVDYREQALHGLRCLLLVGVLPTLLTGVVTVLILAPFDAMRHAALLLVGAAFLLRVGLVGLWPFREVNRLRPGFLLTALAIAAFAYEPIWSGDLLAYAIYGCAGLGIVGLALRLLRLREPRLREYVREG